jgi:hypothetical protein
LSASTTENVIELIVPFLHGKKITYHKFFVPENYHTEDKVKANFVAHAIKSIIENDPKIVNSKEKIYIHCWSDNCKGDFISNIFQYYLSTLCSENLVIIWNTFEAHHSHNISDNQAGSEFKVLKSALDVLDHKKVYSRAYIIKIVSQMKNTIAHTETNIKNYFEGIPDIRKIPGISFHHQFIYPNKGEIIMRTIYGRAGNSKKSNKYTSFIIVNNKSPKNLLPYLGERVFKFVPVVHREETIRKLETKKRLKNEELINKNNKREKKDIVNEKKIEVEVKKGERDYKKIWRESSKETTNWENILTKQEAYLIVKDEIHAKGANSRWGWVALNKHLNIGKEN